MWGRVSGWSELLALLATCVTTLVIQLAAPDLSFTATILTTMSLSTAIWLTVTFLTPPTDPEVLDRFYRQVRPVGFWGPVRARWCVVRCGRAKQTPNTSVRTPAIRQLGCSTGVKSFSSYRWS